MFSKMQRPLPPDEEPTATELCWRNRQQGRRITEDNLPIPAVSPVSRSPRRQGRRWRWVLAGMLLPGMVLAFMAGIVVPWWTGVQDRWNYGPSHISTFSADVGHGGESLFIGEYYHGDIDIIEITAGKAQAYVLTGFVDNTIAPVIHLSVIRQGGKADLLVQVENSSVERVLYNTGTGFTEAQA